MNFFNNPMIGEEELMPLLQAQLAQGRSVRSLPFRGVSMLPMLRQGKDCVELSPLPKELKKYDLPVYRRPDGQYVMHRIVGVKDGYYRCLGDNTVTFETIFPEQMIGLVTAFKRGNRWISVKAPAYQLYCRLWRLTHPFRWVMVCAKTRLRRLLRGRA